MGSHEKSVCTAGLVRAELWKDAIRVLHRAGVNEETAERAVSSRPALQGPQRPRYTLGGEGWCNRASPVTSYHSPGPQHTSQISAEPDARGISLPGSPAAHSKSPCPLVSPKQRPIARLEAEWGNPRAAGAMEAWQRDNEALDEGVLEAQESRHSLPLAQAPVALARVQRSATQTIK